MGMSHIARNEYMITCLLVNTHDLWYSGMSNDVIFITLLCIIITDVQFRFDPSMWVKRLLYNRSVSGFVIQRITRLNICYSQSDKIVDILVFGKS